MCSLTVHLADTRPQIPLTCPSPTRTPSAGPMLSMAPIMHRHVRVGFFRFPFIHLTHITLRFLWCSESTLHYHLGYALASTRIRRRYRCVNLLLSIFLSPQTPPTVHYYLSTAIDRTKQIVEHVKHAHNTSIATTMTPSDAA